MRAMATITAILSVVALVGTASAEEGEKKEGAAAPAGEAKAAGEHAEAHEEEHDWEFYADLVVGHTKAGDDAGITDFSVLPGIERKIAGGFGVGARIPILFGSLSVPDGAPGGGGAFTVGNLEVEPSFETELSETMKLKIFVGVALPTAQGVDPTSPSEGGAKREAVLGAAAAARGGYDNALFVSHHLGIVPGVALPIDSGAVHLTPMAKVELLESLDKEKYGESVTELVVGAKFLYDINDTVGIGIHPWLTQLLSTAQPGEKKTGFVLEPMAKIYTGAGKVDGVNIGVIIPVAGEFAQSESRTFAARVGYTAGF